MTDRYYIGERLVTLLAEADMSQSELARRVGASPKIVGKWCNDISSPALVTLIRIADMFHVSLDWLITGKEYKPRQSPDTKAVNVSTVMDILQDIVHYPDAMIRAGDLITTLETRLMGIPSGQL